MIYELVENDFGNSFVKRINDDGSVSFIPCDPANSDYQAYLATLASESANDSKGNK